MREVILGVSRLTDPPKRGPFSNLTIASLLDDPAIHDVPGLGDEISSACEALKQKVDPIRKSRDKFIAHLDWEAAVKPTDELIPGIPKGLIGFVIQDLGRIYNLHGARTVDQHASFKLEPAGSPKSLISILEQSSEWQDCQEYEARKSAT